MSTSPEKTDRSSAFPCPLDGEVDCLPWLLAAAVASVMEEAGAAGVSAAPPILLLDEGGAALAWEETFTEIQRHLECHSASGGVQTWSIVRWSADGGVWLSSERRFSAGRENRRLIQPRDLEVEGQWRVVLVVSDCVARVWRSGEMVRALHRWGQHALVSIVQTLPHRLWKASALREDDWVGERLVGVRVRADRPGRPNVSLACQPVGYGAEGEDVQGKVAFPLLSLERRDLLSWCDALSGREKALVAGRAWALPPPGGGVCQPVVETEPRQADTDRVLRSLRATMPPRSRELVGLLGAVAPITLPILRMLVREFCPELADEGILAEILLRGILEQLTPDERANSAEEVEFEFVGDLREKILYSMPLNESRGALEVVSDYLEQRSASFIPYTRLVAFLSSGREEDVPEINPESLRYTRIAAMVFAAHGERVYRALARLLEERCAQAEQRSE